MVRRPAILVLLAALLAGCSGGDDGDSGGGGGGSGDGETGRAAPEAVELPADEDFYDLDDLTAAGAHGTLLRYQEVTPTVVEDRRTYRIAYASESVAGEQVVVTGTVLVPEAAAPADGRRVLAIAHGTTGGADACAPSQDPSYAEIAGVGSGVGPDWLVVVTDYEGLGGPGRHPYLVGESEGRSVVDAVLAARSLPGADPGDQVGIAGYSQGGHGALWAAQVAAEYAPELDVIGTVAGAPASETDLVFGAAPQSASAGFSLLLVAGYEQAYPDQADPADILTPAGQERLGLVDELCVADLLGETTGEPEPLYLPTAASNEDWTELAAENVAGQVRLDDPVLVVHSAQDTTVPPVFSELLQTRMCDAGQVIERVVLPEGGSHVAAAIPAYTQGLAWLQGLVDGAEPVSTCP
ncbi:lipase family protein [Blastococcus sp. TF02A-26]|uniref:lipase family protein n=1 Tax=Blastococcus sp. TF02A-26 TaxID=2250577 RepID=UPI000DEBF6A6|nr:lipase family protein [Blastococcus sp. TF02A-26]RBY85140.1 hypothetical protein DQ240_13000 [Blastococcus sp. TF02A-26]